VFDPAISLTQTVAVGNGDDGTGGGDLQNLHHRFESGTHLQFMNTSFIPSRDRFERSRAMSLAH
jgi:hypothetical protein